MAVVKADSDASGAFGNGGEVDGFGEQCNCRRRCRVGRRCGTIWNHGKGNSGRGRGIGEEKRGERAGLWHEDRYYRRWEGGIRCRGYVLSRDALERAVDALCRHDRLSRWSFSQGELNLDCRGLGDLLDQRQA